MNKTELVEAIAKESGLTNADARKSVEAFITTVEKTLKRGDEIALTGFGKFSVVRRSARTGRNPQTGETVRIRASKAPKFTAGAGLKNVVNGARKR
jgi:DNA-binding protein HU-beta